MIGEWYDATNHGVENPSNLPDGLGCNFVAPYFEHYYYYGVCSLLLNALATTCQEIVELNQIAGNFFGIRISRSAWFASAINYSYLCYSCSESIINIVDPSLVLLETFLEG
jgi:hypothetical protein